MHLSLLLDMAADAFGDRRAITAAGCELTYAELRKEALALAGRFTAGQRTVFLGENSLEVPVTLFAAAAAGTAFTPLNYRLTDPELRRVAERAAPGHAVVDLGMAPRLTGVPGLVLTRVESETGAVLDAEPDPEAPAVLLFTSGTTGEPKAAVLRHRHLASYVFSTLEFGGAGEEEAALVGVPPYHIAGLAAIVSSAFVGRRLVYLPSFTAQAWVDAVQKESITHAMVVPTMLGRILDVLDHRQTTLPSLRHLSYGGGAMPVRVVERALARLPHVGFVNAYGLTETSSTISILTPADHREAVGGGGDLGRLGSVGRAHGGIDLSIRGADDTEAPVGEPGEIWVRGPQVSGEYVGAAGRLRADGWFPTNDRGRIDEDGYLYLEGRLDDVIVRGGENISPGEIEDVLRAHPAVRDVAVVGEPSEEWGERIVAVVVAEATTQEELRRFVADRLRSNRVPERVEFRAELPYTETGKLLRRVIRADLVAAT